MTASAPPPPEPSIEIRRSSLQRLQEQSKQRRASMQSHKATVHRMATTVEEIVAGTPPDGTPIHHSESDHDSAVTDMDAVLAAALAEDDDDPVDAGFAALRAQRAQRKSRLEKLKMSAAENTEVCEKITESSKTLRLSLEEMKSMQAAAEKSASR